LRIQKGRQKNTGPIERMLRIAVETLNKTLQGMNEWTWFKGIDTGYGKCSL